MQKMFKLLCLQDHSLLLGKSFSLQKLKICDDILTKSDLEIALVFKIFIFPHKNIFGPLPVESADTLAPTAFRHPSIVPLLELEIRQPRHCPSQLALA
jgi:hypothetical protein